MEAVAHGLHTEDVRHRYGHAPRAQDRQDRGRHLDALRELHHDTVTGTQPERDEAAGDPVAEVVQLGEGDAADVVTLDGDDGGRPGPARRQSAAMLYVVSRGTARPWPASSQDSAGRRARSARPIIGCPLW